MNVGIRWFAFRKFNGCNTQRPNITLQQPTITKPKVKDIDSSSDIRRRRRRKKPCNHNQALE
jgi:hypothetical protein